MDILHLAFRYLRTRLMAWVACVSIVVAVAVMVIVTSVMDGLQARIRSAIRGVEPDLSASLLEAPASGRVFEAVRAELSGEMSSAGGPLARLAPRLESVAIIQTSLGGEDGAPTEDRTFGVKLVGIDWEWDRQVVDWDRLLTVEGDPLSGAVPGILVGRSLGREMGLATYRGPILTDEATLLSWRLGHDEAGQSRYEPSNLIFRMAGAYDSGRVDHDLYYVYVSRAAFRRLRYGEDPTRPDATAVVARLADPDAEVDAVAARLRLSHPTLVIKTWKDRHRSLLTALEVEGVVTSLILGFIVILTVLLLLGVLYSMVREKRRDVGILRSMGIGRARLIGVFTLYGAVLGVAGASGGALLGVIAVRNIDAITDWLHATFGFSVFNPQVFSFRGLPAVLDPDRVLLIGIAAGLLTILAAGTTAWRAAHLEPSTCLNYE